MGKVKEVIKAVKKAVTSQSTNNIYDMSSKESRESTVSNDFYKSKNKRSGQVQKWKRLDEYYHNEHYTGTQAKNLIAQNNWDFTPPVLPDPFIQVESQIDAVVPQVEFHGRDNDGDNLKAKERQAVVDFICYNNKIKQMNTENERSLNKLGNAFWKVAFDGSIQGYGYQGDITIGNPSPSYIFPDSSAYDVDDCEYIIYAYRMHRRKAKRIYGDIVDTCGSNGFIKDTEIFDRDENNITVLDDTVQVMEYWYRDDEGDIACSIQVDFIEVKFIPKYWINTKGSGNQRYPFVKYCKIPTDQSFWDMGEIEAIVDLVDAADREFISAVLTDMMQPSDIIVYEEHALAEGQKIENGPNAMIKMKDNKVNAVKRLGSLGSNLNALNMINFIHGKIEETTGNSSINNGIQPTQVTTASGIAMMNERADARNNIKKADRLTGFEKLYELVDWTALEFYNTERIVMIRGASDTQQDGVFNKSFMFNADSNKIMDKNKAQALTEKGQSQKMTPEDIKKLIGENANYYPPVDIEIAAGSGINKSRAFTLQALADLIKTPINAQNKDIVKSQIDLLDLPDKKDLKESIDNYFAYQMNMPYLFRDMPRFQLAFNDLPQDAQLQVLAQMGIKSQGGLSNELLLDQNKIVSDITGQITPLATPQAPGQQLSPEEMASLQKATPEQQQYILSELHVSPEDYQQMLQGGQQGQTGQQQPDQTGQQPGQQQPGQPGQPANLGGQPQQMTPEQQTLQTQQQAQQDAQQKGAALLQQQGQQQAQQAQQIQQAPQNQPNQPGQNGQQGQEVQQIEADGQLSKDEMQVFLQLTPEMQKKIILDLKLNPRTLATEIQSMQGGKQ